MSFNMCMANNTFKRFKFSILRSILAIFLSLIALENNLNAQKRNRFTGMLEYKVSLRDSLMKDLISDNTMVIYTNDTIVRVENQTDQLGKQVVIRHMEKNKSYLLLDTQIGKFAIQTDHSIRDTVIVESKYDFKNKLCRTKILGKKANCVVASHPSFEEPIEFLYFKDISNKYNNIFESINGLPVKYSIPSADGILDYELVRINEFLPERDMFGIPSDYERLSFDDFLDKMLAPKE